MKKQKTKAIALGAMTCALYVLITLIIKPIANGPVQVRLSEALCVMPCFTPYAIPGLFLGCFISNFITGSLFLDTVFGSIATLIGAVGTYYLKKNKYLCVLPPIISNTLIVPFVLAYVYNFPGSVLYFMATVGIGEIISCGIFGVSFYNLVKRIILSEKL